MSVIIKGMEMPKSCIWRDGMCPLLGDDDGCKLQDCQEEWTWEDQYKGCPLVEVPELHGRLIDADKMCNDITTVDPRYKQMIDWCIRVTKAQPTVIEAEGSE